MKAHGGANIHITNTVAVGEAECLFVFDIVRNALQTAAGERVIAGIHQGDLPGLGILLVYRHGVVCHVEGHIGHVQEVIGEVLLDDIPLVATADDEVIHPMG